jgi:hypothetical protein
VGRKVVAVIVPVAKLRDYVFKPGATHGKDRVFRSLGYAREHSGQLAAIYRQQAMIKYMNKDYQLGKLDEWGQRIIIEIRLQGIGDAKGKTSYLKSGWMIKPDGSISLNTPFIGFSR